MSEESQVDTTLTAEVEGDESQDGQRTLSYEELAAEVAKLRRENGNKRVKNKELDAKLKEYDDWRKSQMSEVDRAKAEKAEVEKELHALRQEKLQSVAARKAKLDPDLADRIKGETEEEMFEDARRLAKKYPASSSSGAGLFGGASGGRPVGEGKEESEDSWFRKQFEK